MLTVSPSPPSLPPPPLGECTNGTVYDSGACRICPAGTWAKREAWGATCSPADSHSYVPMPWSEESGIKPCPSNTLVAEPILTTIGEGGYLVAGSLLLEPSTGGTALANCTCSAGTHRDANGDCRPCPKGTICHGSGFPAYAAPGYALVVRARDSDPIFIACPVKSHCPGGRIRLPSLANASNGDVWEPFCAHPSLWNPSSQLLNPPPRPPEPPAAPPSAPPLMLDDCFCTCSSFEDGWFVHRYAFSTEAVLSPYYVWTAMMGFEYCNENTCVNRYSYCYDPHANMATVDVSYNSTHTMECEEDCTCECSDADGNRNTKRFRTDPVSNPGRCSIPECQSRYSSSCPYARQGGSVNPIYDATTSSLGCEPDLSPPAPLTAPPCVPTEYEYEAVTCSENRAASSALCSVCEDGYAPRISGECQLCNWPPIVYLVATLCLVFTWFPLVRLINIRWMPSMYISLSFVQLLGIFQVMAIGWTESLSTVFASFSLANLNLGFTHVACLGQLRYRDVWILQMLLPLLYVVTAGLHIALMYALTKLAFRSKLVAKLLVRSLGWVPDRNRLRLSTSLDPYLSIGFYFMNMYYYSGMFSSVSMLQCEDNGHGGKYVRMEPELTCYVGEHIVLLRIAIGFTLFYLLIVPATGWWVLFRWVPKHGRDDRRTTLLFGFLYRRFDPKFYYWEAVEISRKLIFVLVVIWGDVASSDQHQAYIESYMIAIFGIVGLLLLEAFNKPYACSLHDSLECVTTVTEAAVLVFGLLLAFNTHITTMQLDSALSSEQTALVGLSADSMQQPTAGYYVSWVAPVTWAMLAVTFLVIIIVAFADVRFHRFTLQAKAVRARRACVLSPDLFDVQICGRLMPTYLESAGEAAVVNFRAMESLLLRRMLRQTVGGGSFRSGREFARIAKAYPGALDWLAQRTDTVRRLSRTEATGSMSSLGQGQSVLQPSDLQRAGSGQAAIDSLAEQKAGEVMRHMAQHKDGQSAADSPTLARARSLAEHIAQGLNLSGGTESFPTLLLFREGIGGDLLRWMSEESSREERKIVASVLTDLQHFEALHREELHRTWRHRLLTALDRRRLPKAAQQREETLWNTASQPKKQYELLSSSGGDVAPKPVKRLSRSGLWKSMGQLPSPTRALSGKRLMKSADEARLESYMEQHTKLLVKLAKNVPCELVASMPWTTVPVGTTNTRPTPHAATYDSRRLVVPADYSDLQRMESVASPAALCWQSAQPTLIDNLLVDVRFQSGERTENDNVDISVLCVPILQKSMEGGDEPKSAADETEKTPGLVGVLKLINKMDVSGRVGVPFNTIDIGIAEIFASLLAEEMSKHVSDHERLQKRRSEITTLASGRAKPQSGLKITVLSAQGLMAADSNGLSDPYATLTLCGVKHKTKTVRRSLDPTWEQSFVWTGEPSTLLKGTLEVVVMDWDMLTRDDLLGKASLSLASFSPSGIVGGQIDGASEEREVALDTQGSVRFRFEWTTTSSGAWQRRRSEEVAPSGANGVKITISPPSVRPPSSPKSVPRRSMRRASIF